jgi:hypothetical protein
MTSRSLLSGKAQRRGWTAQLSDGTLFTRGYLPLPPPAWPAKRQEQYGQHGASSGTELAANII